VPEREEGGVERLGQLCGLVVGGEMLLGAVGVMGLLMTLWDGERRNRLIDPLDLYRAPPGWSRDPTSYIQRLKQLKVQM